MIMVTAATPSSWKYLKIIILNKNVVIPVDSSVNISLLPLAHDLSKTFQSILGLVNLMLLNLRKYTNPISMLIEIDDRVPKAAPMVSKLNMATSI